MARELLMRGRTTSIIILLAVSLISFTLLDYLQIGWFAQWNGGPAIVYQAIVFLVILVSRATVAEFVTAKLLDRSYHLKGLVLSLLIYGPPLIIIILGLSISPIPAYVPIFLERTFVGAVISWLELAIMLDFSRLALLYLMKRANYLD